MQSACVMNEHEYELYLIYTQSKNKQKKHTVYTVMCPSYTNFESILTNFVTLFAPFWLAEVTLDWSGVKNNSHSSVIWETKTRNYKLEPMFTDYLLIHFL